MGSVNNLFLNVAHGADARVTGYRQVSCECLFFRNIKFQAQDSNTVPALAFYLVVSCS